MSTLLFGSVDYVSVTKRILTLVIAATMSFAHQEALSIEFESVVTQSVPKNEPDAIIYQQKEPASPAYPWMELSQIGVSAAPMAGALSFGEVRIRGFSSPQLRMTIDTFDLSNVGTGLLDLHDLPLFASSQLELSPGSSSDVVGSQLALRLNVPPEAGARLLLSGGSNGFMLGETSAASGNLNGSRALLGLQIGQTQGDFIANGRPRHNNDHTRALVFLKSQHAFAAAELELLLFARQHEGGLAGPVTFPTPHLRLLSQKVLFGSALSFRVLNVPMSFRFESKYDRNQTHNEAPTDTDEISFIANGFKLKGEKRFALADTYASLESGFSTSQLLDGSYRRLSYVLEGFINTAPFSFWSLRFRRSANVQLHSDIGFIYGFGSNISATPIAPLTFGIRFAQSARAPTLSEMFAPRGLVIGNPNLLPEKGYDAGLYLNYDCNSKLKLDVDVFYAYLAKAIFYVNRNSFVIEPINAESVHRGGAGLSLAYAPSPLFQMNTRVDWLLSRITATGAPMPGASPLAITIGARVGDEKKVFGRIQTVVSQGASSNLFGTLVTPPYALINASLHAPIFSFARVVLSATNIADVTWARSAYQYPIPGREFFATLEINT